MGVGEGADDGGGDGDGDVGRRCTSARWRLWFYRWEVANFAMRSARDCN